MFGLLAHASATTRYTVYGAAFGCCFPLVSLMFAFLAGLVPPAASTVEFAINAHREFALLYVIDTAPVFLGLLARFAGVRQDRVERMAARLEQEVAEKTESLRDALDDARRANEHILHLAEHDTLTGLLNRRRFEQELHHHIGVARRHHRKAALLFIDVDKFKPINDNFGHSAGDEYLAAVADLLRLSLRSTDILARWGGDEFVILLPESGASGANDVARKLQQVFGEARISLGGQEFPVSISIGIALFPEHTLDPDKLVDYADAAMYRAKANGGGGSCVRDGTGTLRGEQAEDQASP